MRRADRSKMTNRRHRIRSGKRWAPRYVRDGHSEMAFERLESRAMLSVTLSGSTDNSVLPGTPLTVYVEAVEDDQIASAFDSPITLSLAGGPGTLGGTLTVQPTQGESVFTVTLNSVNVGTYLIHASASDATSVDIQVEVAGLQKFPDPQNPSLQNLVWYGLPGLDQIKFRQTGNGIVEVTQSMQDGQAVSLSQTFTGINGRVIGNGMDGDDTIDASGLTNIHATLDGGSGSNTLYGGQAGDILSGGANGGEGRRNIIVGGSGNDVIYGNEMSGNGGEGGNNLILGGAGDDAIYGNYQYFNGAEGGMNLVVGGEGKDTLYGNSSDVSGGEGAHAAYNGEGSILISGTTSLNLDSLIAVHNEWIHGDASTKEANIKGTGSGGLNGTNYLISGVTVFNDTAVDRVYANFDPDTFASTHPHSWLFYDFDHDILGFALDGDTKTDL